MWVMWERKVVNDFICTLASDAGANRCDLREEMET